MDFEKLKELLGKSYRLSNEENDLERKVAELEAKKVMFVSRLASVKFELTAVNKALEQYQEKTK